MNLMPPPGPQRRRLFFLLGLLAVAFVVLYYQWSSATAVPETTTARTQKSPVDDILNPTGTKPPVKAAVPAPGSQVPEALKLAQIERVPDEPEPAGRNLFRFGVPPPPPPAPTPAYVPPVVVDPPKPTPPPIPRVPLKYTMYVKDPEGRNRASLTDPSGVSFQAVEGDLVDGRYRLHKVTPTSVEVSWANGTGRRTIPLGGGG